MAPPRFPARPLFRRGKRAAREERRTTGDLLDTPALRVMRYIYRNGAPINMRVFTEQSGVTPPTAKLILDELAEDGLVSSEVVVPRPVGAVLEIGLTNDGRKVAEHNIAMLEARERAKKRRG